MNYIIHGVVFTDDAIHIEYSEATNTPFSQSIQLRIPYQASQLHKQLAEDMGELLQDAHTVLDAALMARLGAVNRVEEMGRS